MPNLASMPRNTTSALIFTFHSVAIFTTLQRLFHRFRTRRLWWDDFWALVALSSDVALLILYLVFTSKINAGKPKGAGPKVPRVPTASELAIRWMTLMFYTITLWTARLTVSVTIVRLLPHGPKQRVAKGVSILFGLMMVAIMLQKVVACTPVQGRAEACSSVKNYKAYTAILELVTDGLADLWLVLAPAYIFLKMKLQPGHRRLVLAIFLCGIFTSLASISHAVFLFINTPLWVMFTGHVQVTIAIVVSNLLVVVTYFYRAFRHRANNGGVERNATSHTSEASSHPTRGTRQEEQFTTVTSSTVTRQTTTFELTDVSHLGSTFDAPHTSGLSCPTTAGSTSDAPRSTTFSSFSYPSHIQHPPARVL